MTKFTRDERLASTDVCIICIFGLCVAVHCVHYKFNGLRQNVKFTFNLSFCAYCIKKRVPNGESKVERERETELQGCIQHNCSMPENADGHVIPWVKRHELKLGKWNNSTNIRDAFGGLKLRAQRLSIVQGHSARNFEPQYANITRGIRASLVTDGNRCAMRFYVFGSSLSSRNIK